MKRVTTLLVIATLLTMLLAACTTASDQQSEAVPGVTEPLPGATEPVSGLTTPQIPLDEYETAYPAAEEATGGEAPAVETAPSEVIPTEPVEATAEVTEPAVIPPTGPMDPGRISNLFGSPVSSQDGEEIGLIDDFIVDLSTGAVNYVVVAVSEEEGTEVLLVPIPIALLSWDASNGILKLATDRQTVLGAPYLEGGEYPNTQEAGWEAEYDAYWESVIPGS